MGAIAMATATALRAAQDSPGPDQIDVRPKTAPADAINRVATYVPSEALAVYIGVVGVLGATTLGPQTAAAVIGILSNMFFVYVALDGRRKEVECDHKPFRRKLAKEIGIAEWAFIVYVAALPENPLTHWDWYALRYGAVAAILTAAVLPFLARKLGVGPKKGT